MKLTNYEIYNYAQKLNSAFTKKDQYLPAKLNFFIQKNARILGVLAEEIEKNRISIVQHYGILEQETGNFQIPKDKMAEASQELEDLFLLEQEVSISMVNIDKFGDIDLSIEQMSAIMFMVEEE